VSDAAPSRRVLAVPPACSLKCAGWVHRGGHARGQYRRRMGTSSPAWRGQFARVPDPRLDGLGREITRAAARCAPQGQPWRASGMSTARWRRGADPAGTFRAERRCTWSARTRGRPASSAASRPNVCSFGRPPGPFRLRHRGPRCPRARRPRGPWWYGGVRRRRAQTAGNAGVAGSDADPRNAWSAPPTRPLPARR